MNKYGLQRTPGDERDFPFEKVFGAARPVELPREYFVNKPIAVKDQGEDTDMCAAYAASSVSEDQELTLLDPFYTFARTKQIMNDKDSWGADLRSTCKAAVKYGFREAGQSHLFDIEKASTPDIRDQIVHWEDYSAQDDRYAAEHRKQSFFSVGSVGDVFDGMRSALYQGREEERSVLTGIEWLPSWDQAKNGLVTKFGEGQKYGHAIKIFGWEVFRAEPYLLAQLSNGESIGDKGIFRLSRQVINLGCRYGAFTFSDMPRVEAEYQLKKISWFRYWLRSLIS
jgi:hypothetical protein